MLRSGLFWKIFGAALALILLTAAAAAWVASERMVDDVRVATEGVLEDEILLLEALLGPPLMAGPDETFQARVRDLGQSIRTRITVIGPDGTVVADSSKSPDAMDNHGRRPEVLASRDRPFGRALRHSDTLETDMVYVARTLHRGSAVAGTLRVAQPLLRIEERLAVLRRTALGAAGIALLIGLGGALLVAHRLARPLRRMTRAASAIAAGDYDRRVLVQTRDELGKLGQAFNAMAARLARDVETMRRDRRELRAILGGMAEGVVAVDPDERVVLLNQVAARILDVDASSARGRPLWELFRRPLLQDTLTEAIEAGEPREAELEFLVGQEERILRLYASPLVGGDGARRGVVLVLQDVTERRRVDAVRRDFIANASHELKTPVASIRALTETVLSDPGMDEETRQGFLGRIARQAGRLGALIEEMLALSRLESRTPGTGTPAASVRAPIVEALEDAAAAAEQVGAQIETDLGESDAWVQGDPEAVRRIVANLVDNAIQHGGRGGRVRVQVTAGADDVSICVRDTGPGIPSDQHGRIFERFYRIDSGRSRHLGGTGLGLAIVKHLVQALGGRIEVESRPGQGSTFLVHLPRADAGTQ